MTRGDRILDHLRVEPGTARRDRRPRSRLDRRPGLRRAHARRAQARGEGGARAGRRAALGGAGAALGERQPRAARRLPGHGRRRQGQRHRARHVGRQPAGRPGLLVQDALGRGARPRLPLADPRRPRPSAAGSASSTARTTRRSSRCVCTPSGSTSSGCRRSPDDPGFWEERFEDINAFERHLDRNGTKIVKFFLHVSKAEQKRRFLARLDEPHREWKFNAADVAERARWDEYMAAYEDALTATSTPWAPWYVIPADHKWRHAGARRRDPRRHDPRARSAVAAGAPRPTTRRTSRRARARRGGRRR